MDTLCRLGRLAASVLGAHMLGAERDLEVNDACTATIHPLRMRAIRDYTAFPAYS